MTAAVTVSQPKVAFDKLTQRVGGQDSDGVLKEEIEPLTAAPDDEVEPLPAATRRERMLRLIADRDFVRVADLSRAFGISDVTVRADLAALELSHAVRRVRGGVMAPSRSIATERSFEEAQGERSAEKERLGRHAASMVSSGMSVLIDVGTTTAAVARALADRQDLDQVVVITNGLNIALELERGIDRITVVLTGGTLRRLQHSLVNPMATVLLDRVRADVAFLGCSGIDAEHGITNLNLPEAEVKRHMIASARRTVVVADGSKLGAVHLGRVGTLAEVHTVLTGGSAPEHELQRLRRAGGNVVQVE